MAEPSQVLDNFHLPHRLDSLMVQPDGFSTPMPLGQFLAVYAGMARPVSKADLLTLLGYTPYDALNPATYISRAETQSMIAAAISALGVSGGGLVRDAAHSSPLTFRDGSSVLWRDGSNINIWGP